MTGSAIDSSLDTLFDHIARLSSEKRMLFEALLKERGVDPLQILPIPRRKESGFSPLSYPQQRLWLAEQLMPGGAVYNIPIGIRFRGQLNFAALEQCFNEIVRRHEILRTGVHTIDGQTLQFVDATLRLAVPHVDLSRLREAEQGAVWKRLSREHAQRQFDLSRGPLLRVTLTRLGPEDHALQLTIHHIATDAWSNNVLIREWGILYQSYRNGSPSSLAELPIQYADYSCWQRQWELHETLKSQLTYWTRQLTHAQWLLELPTDRPRRSVRTFGMGSQSFVLPRALSEGITGLSLNEDVTLFMTLLAAYKVLLYRYTGQDRFCVGSPIAGRRRPETEALIGCFVNMLALCTDLSGKPSFRELLCRVREVTLGAYAHQDLHFEQLVKALNPERNLAHTPLVQVTFTFQNIPVQELRLPGLEPIPLGIDGGSVEYDLSLIMQGGAEALGGVLMYSNDLFDACTVNQMLTHFRIILEHVVANPEMPVLRIPLIKDAKESRGAHTYQCHTNDKAEQFVFRIESNAE